MELPLAVSTGAECTQEAAKMWMQCMNSRGIFPSAKGGDVPPVLPGVSNDRPTRKSPSVAPASPTPHKFSDTEPGKGPPRKIVPEKGGREVGIKPDRSPTPVTLQNAKATATPRRTPVSKQD